LDRTKEQIKFNTEVLKLIFVLMVASAGGALSLIIDGLAHARDVISAAGGMIIAITCLIITFIRYRITQHLIDRL
jgi:membrane-associated phospholipid phosphatase